MKRRSKYWISAISAVMAAGLMTLTATSAKAQAAAPDLHGVTITVGQQGTDNEFGFLASHLFDDTPYKVAYASFPGPGATLTALASGNIDLANNVSQWTAMQAASANPTPWTPQTAPYKNILVSAPGNPAQFDRFVIAAAKGTGITDIRQSKGKRWGIIPGSSLNLMANVVLSKLGWKASDVEIVNLDATNQVLALETGQVDILFNVTDNLVGAVEHGAKIIGTANDFGLTIYTGFIASAKALNDPLKSAALADFTRRLVQFQNWNVQHPKEAQAAIVSGLHLTAPQAETLWKFARVIPVAPADIAKSSQELVDIALASGLVKNKVDASALLDNRYGAIIDATVKSSGYLANLKASYGK